MSDRVIGLVDIVPRRIASTVTEAADTFSLTSKVTARSRAPQRNPLPQRGLWNGHGCFDLSESPAKARLCDPEAAALRRGRGTRRGVRVVEGARLESV